MTRVLEGLSFDATLQVEAFEDPVGEVIGVDARSSYVTRFWLPFLGPSTTLLLQLLARYLDAEPRGCHIEVATLSWSLGLGEREGRHAPLVRAIGRATDYRLATMRGPAHLAVRRRLPPLPPRLAARLPGSLASEHVELLRGSGEVVALDALARRGRQLALSLLVLGESVEEAERQLLRWRFTPQLARRCARWAAEHAPDGGAGSNAQADASLLARTVG